jgi:hypothetical protein
MEITLGDRAELPLNKPLFACSVDFHGVLFGPGLLPESVLNFKASRRSG